MDMKLDTKPAFLQGTFKFTGAGFDAPLTLDGAKYKVPDNKRSQLVYFRAGQTGDEPINLVLLRNGETMRLFPLGMKSAMHFPLAIQEYLEPGSELQLKLIASQGLTGAVFVDLGFMEHPK
jgi:hypothetical protein